jgi:diacylglycerol kinase family enzyme
MNNKNINEDFKNYINIEYDSIVDTIKLDFTELKDIERSDILHLMYKLVQKKLKENKI